jgi:hypothetical protein
MSDWLMRVIKAEAERLIEMAALDDELRADLRALAESILAAMAAVEPKTDASSPSLSAQAAPVATAAEDIPYNPATSEVPRTDSPQGAEPLRELTLGRSSPSKSKPRSVRPVMTPPQTTHDELTQIETRCRRKGEAARWAAERVRRLREGNDFQAENPPAEPEMVDWANRLTDCFFWKSASQTSQQADISLLDDVGGCFESLAEALAVVWALLKEQPGNARVWDRTLPLVAEAQSALRVALQRLGAPNDPEQVEVFDWLKASAARYHVYIKRFMRADELADPTGWQDLLARVESLAVGGQLPRQASSQIERIREHVKRLQGNEGDDQDWPAIISAVDAIVGEGVPPSNREIRELLLPVIDELPERDELPDGFRLVLREIDRFLGTRSSQTRSSVSHEPSAAVKEVARLLAGRSILLIGGNRRREAQESLRKALGLLDLVWIETKEHQSIDAFEPLIARPDVALVLLAIRWSSHAFGDVKQFCDRHGKPLVRLPGGYSPNQVAVQILSQCSEQLGDRSTG